MSGTTLVFDLESNGLLHDVTCIHCLVIYEQETDTTIVYNDQGNAEPLTRGVQRLEDADIIVGHNIIGYDIPCLSKIYPWFSPTALVVDTLLLSRLYHTDMLDIDMKEARHDHIYGGIHLNLTAIGCEYKGSFGKTTLERVEPRDADYCYRCQRCKLCDHFHRYLNGSYLSTK